MINRSSNSVLLNFKFNEMSIIKVGSTVEENYVSWKILQRTGNIALVEGSPVGGIGRMRWDVVTIFKDGEEEKFKSNLNFSGEADSPNLNKSVMAEAFNKTVERIEHNRKAKESFQRDEAERLRIANIWNDAVEEIRAEQAVLITKLKSYTHGKRGILDNKKITEIAEKLMIIDAILHHGKPRY